VSELAAAAERRGLNGRQVGGWPPNEIFSPTAAMVAVTAHILTDNAIVCVQPRSPVLLAAAVATLAAGVGSV
jgi:alkanesulfonate monooxygenase SsuD/methylene tetrahydromethanopterin reductase-like flavin-dependent oxidoreductase (luciferase family)